jgi:hypothetical protein
LLSVRTIAGWPTTSAKVCGRWRRYREAMKVGSSQFAVGSRQRPPDSS